MTAVDFKESNITFTGKDCYDLKAFIDEQGVIVSCWEFTEEEIELIKKQLEAGEKPKIYTMIASITQPPITLEVSSPFEETETESMEEPC